MPAYFRFTYIRCIAATSAENCNRNLPLLGRFRSKSAQEYAASVFSNAPSPHATVERMRRSQECGNLIVERIENRGKNNDHDQNNTYRQSV